MKKKMMVLALLAGGSMFAQTRFSIGINVGGYGRPYAPVSSYAYNRPPSPGPDFVWVDGYWSQDRGRNFWVAGYWQRRPYQYYAPRRDWDRDGDRGFRDRGRDWDRDGDRGYRFRR
jgi:WXXGXW repeat (2 copies)